MSDVGDGTFRILVLCTGNSARSQIAEALLSMRGGRRITAVSAGSRPAASVSRYAVEVLREHGVAWDGHRPKSIDAVLGQRFDLAITVCDHAQEACPFFPGARVQVHWGLPDPAEHADTAAARRAFRQTYDALVSRVDALLALRLEELDDAHLREAAQSVHPSAGDAS